MLISIKKFGLFIGIIRGSERLLRCNGFQNPQDYTIFRGKFFDPVSRSHFGYIYGDITKEKNHYQADKGGMKDNMIPIFWGLSGNNIKKISFILFLLKKNSEFTQLEVEKLIFSSQDTLITKIAKLILAMIEFQNNKYKNVIESLEGMQFKNSKVTDLISLYIRGECLYRIRDYLTAMKIFEYILEHYRSVGLIFERALLRYIQSCILSGQFSKLTDKLSLLDQLTTQISLDQLTQVKKILSTKSKKLKQVKSPKISVLLSSLIPGLGQIYCGHLMDGLVAFSINVGLAYIAYDSYKKGYYGGLVIGVYFGLPFYFGNVLGAKRMAENETMKNRISLAEWVESIFKLSTNPGLVLEADTLKFTFW
jgi:TM2 domain-containing membrane protein YozV